MRSDQSIQQASKLSFPQVALRFLLDYPLGAKLRQHVEFYVTQLEYEYETGREAALDMLCAVFNSFPQVSAASGAHARACGLSFVSC